MLKALITELASIEGPRCAWKVGHRLLDILAIAVCAVLGKAETFEDIALYGRCKRAWLEGFLALPNGIPSHDTFRRVPAWCTDRSSGWRVPGAVGECSLADLGCPPCPSS